jgi:hypothetical protein
MSTFKNFKNGNGGTLVGSASSAMVVTKASSMKSRSSDSYKVRKIVVSNNNSTTGAKISIFLTGDQFTYPVYFVKDLDVPASVTWIWDEEFSFNTSKFELEITNGNATDITVIMN